MCLTIAHVANSYRCGYEYQLQAMNIIIALGTKQCHLNSTLNLSLVLVRPGSIQSVEGDFFGLAFTNKAP